MRCFICYRDEKEVMMMKLPLDTAYENIYLSIVGNYSEKDYICLPCIGFQFDDEMRKIS